MRLALIAGLALAGLMQEAEDQTSAGGAASEPTPEPKSEPTAEDTQPQAAPNVADTTGDTDHQPPGAHLDRAAQGDPQAEAAPQPEPEKTEDELANAFRAGKPKVALVGKYNERIPVQLKDRAHLEKLEADHPGAVEVQ